MLRVKTGIPQSVGIIISQNSNSARVKKILAGWRLGNYVDVSLIKVPMGPFCFWVLRKSEKTSVYAFFLPSIYMYFRDVLDSTKFGCFVSSVNTSTAML